MSMRLIELFKDEVLVARIKKRLPYLFRLAELESSRAGRIGMEVGTLRERILVALLIYKFGEKNVETEIPITESEIDLKLFGEPISIKTITGRHFGGVKIIWTVDAEKARQFRQSYYPSCDILLARINWGDIGGVYQIPLERQRNLFEKIGKDKYIKLPKPGTNPRGVEISGEALSELATDRRTNVIDIFWEKTEVAFNAYRRWLDYWKED